MTWFEKFLCIFLGIIIILALCGQIKCQTFDDRPKLELEPRLNLNGGGFQLVSGSMTGGTGMETKHLVWHVYGTFDEARKTNDGDQPNPHGNIRSLGANLFGRTSGGWLFGTEGSYAQLRTTNYDKTGWGLAVGGGKDFMELHCPNCNGTTSLRLTMLYAIPAQCTYTQSLHCTIPKVDVEQGISARVMIPSPVETTRHVFFDVNTFAGWIRTTSTGPLTHDASTSIGVLFRF